MLFDRSLPFFQYAISQTAYGILQIPEFSLVRPPCTFLFPMALLSASSACECCLLFSPHSRCQLSTWYHTYSMSLWPRRTLVGLIVLHLVTPDGFRRWKQSVAQLTEVAALTVHFISSNSNLNHQWLVLFNHKSRRWFNWKGGSLLQTKAGLSRWSAQSMRQPQLTVPHSGWKPDITWFRAQRLLLFSTRAFDPFCSVSWFVRSSISLNIQFKMSVPCTVNQIQAFNGNSGLQWFTPSRQRLWKTGPNRSLLPWGYFII